MSNQTAIVVINGTELEPELVDTIGAALVTLVMYVEGAGLLSKKQRDAHERARKVLALMEQKRLIV